MPELREFLVLRFDAPFMAFGGPSVDQRRVSQAVPALSMLVGMVANALGWDHADSAKLEALQRELEYACRIDRRGDSLVDYQTVDLGQSHLDDRALGWTTRGKMASRAGAFSKGTHIRLREYLTDARRTITLGLAPAGDATTVAEVRDALQYPARPLFLGRKACLPSAPIFRETLHASSALHALAMAPHDGESESRTSSACEAWWTDGDDPRDEHGESLIVASQLRFVSDERSWRDQVHVGRRALRHGRIRTIPTPNDESGHAEAGGANDD